MDLFHQLASRRQADALTNNLVLLRANSPTDKRIELLIVNEADAKRVGKAITRHSYLQAISFTLVAAADPLGHSASLIEYVHHRKSLTTLSLVTAYLLKQDGTSTLEQREPMVDAFLKAAIANPSITCVSLECCRYRAGRLAELLRKPGFKSLTLLNCRSLDDLSLPENERTLLNAFQVCHTLETLVMRRSFEPPSVEGNILMRMSGHPQLTHLGLSIQNVRAAAIFRAIIQTFPRSMLYSLLGCDLEVESAAHIIEGLMGRIFEFRLDLQGCKWNSHTCRDVFLKQLIHCPKLASLSIDVSCGLSPDRIKHLEGAVSLQR